MRSSDSSPSNGATRPNPDASKDAFHGTASSLIAEQREGGHAKAAPPATSTASASAACAAIGERTALSTRTHCRASPIPARQLLPLRTLASCHCVYELRTHAGKRVHKHAARSGVWRSCSGRDGNRNGEASTIRYAVLRIRAASGTAR